eukprot:62054_1
MIVSNSAPGVSRYNRIERRMAPLSKELVGLVLKHDQCGSHLDNQKQTIDEDLERKNFKKCGEALAHVWNQTTIDGYGVKAEYLEPTSAKDKEVQFDDYEEKWMTKHCQHGYHFLMFIKCDDAACCGVIRSNILDILDDRKFPAPRYYSQQKGILSLGKRFQDVPPASHYASFTISQTLKR